ncbi:MAG: hypothetical protein ACI835_001276 [Planctomycetota bacterium]|jgi:hypothetical protein
MGVLAPAGGVSAPIDESVPAKVPSDDQMPSVGPPSANADCWHCDPLATVHAQARKDAAGASRLPALVVRVVQDFERRVVEHFPAYERHDGRPVLTRGPPQDRAHGAHDVRARAFV